MQIGGHPGDPEIRGGLLDFPDHRVAVLKAVEEFDALGQEEFLSRHGFGDARSHHLFHDGRYFPSKAIVGLAQGAAHARALELLADDNALTITGRLPTS